MSRIINVFLMGSLAWFTYNMVQYKEIQIAVWNIYYDLEAFWWGLSRALQLN